MPMPTSGVSMEDLTEETSETLDGSEMFVMFDSEEGKKASIGTIATAILSKLNFADPNNDGNIIVSIAEENDG